MSRWGNFLSGIESGLDRILADNEGEKQAQLEQLKQLRDDASTNASRSSSARRKPDKLQDRLNKAVEGRKSEDSRAQSGASADSRDSETLTTESSKTLDVGRKDARTEVVEQHFKDSSDYKSPEPARSSLDVKPTNEEDIPLRDEISPDVEDSLPGKADVNAVQPAGLNEETERFTSDDAPSAAETLRDEHFYLEHIEALQVKVNHFIQEAARKAKESRELSTPGSDAHREAQRDEQIAALLSEGQKLSEREVQLTGNTKRLRTRNHELELSLEKERKASSDAQREMRNLRSKLESSEHAHKVAIDQNSANSMAQNELGQLKKQNELLLKGMATLRTELEQAKSNSDVQKRNEDQKRQIEVAEKTLADLKDELESTKIEKELSTGRHNAQLTEEKAKATQERERAAATEAELQGEIKALESRLETMRSRSEEATGGSTDQQAKHLRQIEALQRQFSISKENWNGIESSMESRIHSLEQERDDLVKKEGDLRRRLRESATNLRKVEEELEESTITMQSIEDKLRTEQNASAELRAATTRNQTELEQVRTELREVKASKTAAIETHDPQDIPDSPSTFNPNERPYSPAAYRNKSNAAMHGDLRERRHPNGIGFPPTNNIFPERPGSSRKVSVASPQLSNYSNRQQPFASLTRSSSRSALQDTLSITEGENDPLEEAPTSYTPGRGFNDMLSASASAPAAGPSVQLVERMSAAVRRLESEKAATRDELDRMLSERDEARAQIVSLLEEVQVKHDHEKKVAELEKQVAEIGQRYQTTLELLGEKSEMVEELKADIADMKQIYRETLEKSVR